MESVRTVDTVTESTNLATDVAFSDRFASRSVERYEHTAFNRNGQATRVWVVEWPGSLDRRPTPSVVVVTLSHGQSCTTDEGRLSTDTLV